MHSATAALVAVVVACFAAGSVAAPFRLRTYYNSSDCSGGVVSWEASDQSAYDCTPANCTEAAKIGAGSYKVECQLNTPAAPLKGIGFKAYQNITGACAQNTPFMQKFQVERGCHPDPAGESWNFMDLDTGTTNISFHSNCNTSACDFCEGTFSIPWKTCSLVDPENNFSARAFVPIYRSRLHYSSDDCTGDVDSYEGNIETGSRSVGGTCAAALVGGSGTDDFYNVPPASPNFYGIKVYQKPTQCTRIPDRILSQRSTGCQVDAGGEYWNSIVYDEQTNVLTFKSNCNTSTCAACVRSLDFTVGICTDTVVANTKVQAQVPAPEYRIRQYYSTGDCSGPVVSWEAGSHLECSAEACSTAQVGSGSASVRCSDTFPTAPSNGIFGFKAFDVSTANCSGVPFMQHAYYKAGCNVDASGKFWNRIDASFGGSNLTYAGKCNSSACDSCDEPVTISSMVCTPYQDGRTLIAIVPAATTTATSTGSGTTSPTGATGAITASPTGTAATTGAGTINGTTNAVLSTATSTGASGSGCSRSHTQFLSVLLTSIAFVCLA